MSRIQEFGRSTMAKSFGASVDISLPGQGMYLVIGCNSSVSSLVRAAGGQIGLKISANKILAMMSISTYLAFRRHPDIKFIGPTALDQDRFGQFMELLKRNPNQNLIN